MSVRYRTLTALYPRAYADSSKELSTVVTRLAVEYQQYKTHVVKPLKARRAWSGGGQPDAAVVTEVNGLSIDTMRLRLATGAVAYLYAYIGFTLAQQQLAGLCRSIENDGMSIDADGNVSSETVPIGDDNGPGSTSAKAQAYQARIGKVLTFATTIDRNTAHALNTSHEPPLTALTNRPGLLDQAVQDHADAAADASSMSSTFELLPHDAAQQLPSDDGDLSWPSVTVPATAGALSSIGAIVAAAGLGMIEAGIGGGLALGSVTAGTSTAAGIVVTAGGILVTLAGGVMIVLGGTTLTQTTISLTSANPPKPPDDLDRLLQQSRDRTTQTGHDYGRPPKLEVSNKQFGKKIRKHAHDYGLDPADPSARRWLRSHIEDIGTAPDEIRRGSWRGADGYLFYRRGSDVVVAKPNGDFVTILRKGSGNGSFMRAEVIG